VQNESAELHLPRWLIPHKKFPWKRLNFILTWITPTWKNLLWKRSYLRVNHDTLGFRPRLLRFAKENTPLEGRWYFHLQWSSIPSWELLMKEIYIRMEQWDFYHQPSFMKISHEKDSMLRGVKRIFHLLRSITPTWKITMKKINFILKEVEWISLPRSIARAWKFSWKRFYVEVSWEYFLFYNQSFCMENFHERD
jgi:hypothetical protein